MVSYKNVEYPFPPPKKKTTNIYFLWYFLKIKLLLSNYFVCLANQEFFINNRNYIEILRCNSLLPERKYVQVQKILKLSGLLECKLPGDSPTRDQPKWLYGFF